MIVHLLAPSIYAKDYYSFLNRNFEQYDFTIYCNLNQNKDKFSDIFDSKDYEKDAIKVYSPISLRFLIDMYRSKIIIIHGLFNIWYTFFLVLNPWLLKKCNWVIWGGDIYCHNDTNKSIKEKIRERLKLFIGKRIASVSVLANKDDQLVRQWYGFNGKTFYVKYPTPLTRPGNYEMLNEARKLRCNKLANTVNSTINIMIGNSATRTNQHREALEILKKFKDEDIKIYLPLSYGTDSDHEEYAQNVISYAEEIFGSEKIVPLLKQLDGTEYYKLISRIDIGLFNCNRQQAMGNITILFSSGAKVYIRDDTSMWNEYISRGNIVYNVEDIRKENFTQFCYYSNAVSDKNAEVIFQNASNEANMKRWNNVFCKDLRE